VERFPGFWQHRSALSTALLPLAALYGLISGARRRYYRLRPPVRLPVPVIVVGNIFVGGTGKTPLVVHVVEALRARGRRPGIVTRGYGGRSREWPQRVTPLSAPELVGDEPVLLAQRAACPVVAAPDRVAAARQLLRDEDVDVIVSDDGLQHYRLARDLELVVIDAARGLGNGRLLPAGPLREPPARLRSVDMVLCNGGVCTFAEHSFELEGDEAVNLLSAERRPLEDSRFMQGVHAVAGIGNPSRFFAALRARGIPVVPHPKPDHHAFVAEDLTLPGEGAVLMTEKDAVKCRAFASGREWYVPVSARLDPAAQRRLEDLLDRTIQGAS
jgi:tetraacyldisaccharide 4'-kinase